jgi:hypothetical protein
MAIIIRRLEEINENGPNEYEVRINKERICTFWHDYYNGLVRCIESAAVSVMKKRDRSAAEFARMMEDVERFECWADEMTTQEQ